MQQRPLSRPQALTIGAPADSHEREATAIESSVMEDAPAANVNFVGPPNSIARQDAGAAATAAPAPAKSICGPDVTSHMTSALAGLDFQFRRFERQRKR